MSLTPLAPKSALFFACPLVLALACTSGAAPTRVGGLCANVDDGTDCDAGLCCGGVCRTFEADSNNCGACGLQCPNGQQCAGGTCLTCAVLTDGASCHGDTYDVGACCSGSCLDIFSDLNNCGGCGSACPLKQNCVDAGCVPQCVNQPDGTTCALAAQGDGLCCGQACTDPKSDSANCASCGAACGTGITCRGGVCL